MPLRCGVLCDVFAQHCPEHLLGIVRENRLALSAAFASRHLPRIVLGICLSFSEAFAWHCPQYLSSIVGNIGEVFSETFARHSTRHMPSIVRARGAPEHGQDVRDKCMSLKRPPRSLSLQGTTQGTLYRITRQQSNMWVALLHLPQDLGTCKRSSREASNSSSAVLGKLRKALSGAPIDRFGLTFFILFV